MKKSSGFKMKGFSGFGNSPVKHTGAEMYSAKNNPLVDRGHGKEGVPEYKTIIANRLKSEAKHDAYHAKFPNDDGTHTSTARNTGTGKFAVNKN